MVRIQEISQVDVAAMLGVSVKTIQRRLNRSLLLLSQALQDETRTEDHRDLELILDTGCDPEVACAQLPELLPEILVRLRQVRRVEQQLNQLFPHSQVSNAESQISAPKNPAYFRHAPTIPGYSVEGLLGSGGMGVVYKARHQKLNRIVALKMLRADILLHRTN